MLDYGFNFMNTNIYIDNESMICIVNNPVFHSKTKHIEIRHHFIRDAYKKKLIQEHVSKQGKKKAKIGTNIKESADYDVNKGRSNDKFKVLNVKAEGVNVAGKTFSTDTLAVSTVSVQPVLVLLKLLCSYWV
nr:putative ribonuclease H-like domain-containing protein [Tanacetum cinerariifolium]